MPRSIPASTLNNSSKVVPAGRWCRSAGSGSATRCIDRRGRRRVGVGAAPIGRGGPVSTPRARLPRPPPRATAPARAARRARRLFRAATLAMTLEMYGSRNVPQMPAMTALVRLWHARGGTSTDHRYAPRDCGPRQRRRRTATVHALKASMSVGAGPVAGRCRRPRSDSHPLQAIAIDRLRPGGRAVVFLVLRGFGHS